MKDPNSAHKLKQLIEGFVALCMGSSDCLVWMDQDDAAAFSDAGHVFLPRPQGIEGERDLLLGIAMREVAKCTHSDASKFQSAPAEHSGYAAAIEDARIKSAISEDYKGAPSIFDASTAVVHRVAMETVAANPENIELVKQFAVWFAANDAYLGTPAAHLAATEFAAVAQSQFDPGAVQRALGLAQASTFLASTKAAVECGGRIHALLKPPEQQQPQPEQQDGTAGNADAESAGEDGQDQDADAGGMQDGDAEGSASPENGSPDSGEQQQNNGPGGQPSESQSKSSSRDAEASQGQDAMSQDVMSNALAMLKGFVGAKEVAEPVQSPAAGKGAVDAELQSALDAALADSSSMERIDAIVAAMQGESADGSEADEEVDLTMALGASAETAKVTYLPGANSLDGLPARMVNVLLRELHDKRPTKMLRRESGYDIDVGNVWKLKRLGDTRVFRKKTPSAGVDAAVNILLDVSGSMEDCMEVAASATHAFALALQRIAGVQTAIDVFPSEPGPTQNILKYRENPAKAKAKLQGIQATGGTPTDTAICEVLPALLNVQVHKRAIVLITDGIPDNPAATLIAIADANRRGVDVIGIGIGARARIESILPDRSTTITSVADLPRALEELFKSKLSSSMLAA